MNQSYPSLRCVALSLVIFCAACPTDSSSRASDLAAAQDLLRPRDLSPPADLRSPPDMTPPVPYGPLGMFDHAPAWARQDPSDWVAENVWRRAAPVRADELRDVRIVCYVSARAAFDTFRGADLNVTARIGAGPFIVHKSMNDKNSSQVLIAVPALHTGDEILLSVADRDVWTTEGIGALVAPYSGRFPQLIEQGQLSADCRAMTREQGINELPASVAALNAAMQKIRLTPNPKLVDFGRVDSGIPEALIAMSQVAAFVGWEHPVVKERAAFLAKRLDAWDENCGQTLRRITDRLPTAGEPVDVKNFGRLRGLPPRCAKPPDIELPAKERNYLEHYGCVLKLEITPARPIPLETYLCVSEKHKRTGCLKPMRLVLGDGRTAKPSLLSFRDVKTADEVNPLLLSELLPGTTYVLTFNPELPTAAPPARNRPLLLEGEFGTLRLD